jgi:hypothetical protein
MCWTFRRQKPDLVILDLMLPGLDGLQVCRLLRQESQSLPILMLTARDDSHDQVLGLEMGADDYVTKPCEPRVLLARVRTLLRRSSINEPRLDNDQILIGGLRIDLAERTVTWRGEEVELSSGEYNLLVVLARNAGEVLSRDRSCSNCAASSSTAPTVRWTWPSPSCGASSTTTPAKRARSRPCGARATCSAVRVGVLIAMLKILVRLYLVIIVAYAGALLLIPMPSSACSTSASWPTTWTRPRACSR